LHGGGIHVAVFAGIGISIIAGDYNIIVHYAIKMVYNPTEGVWTELQIADCRLFSFGESMRASPLAKDQTLNQWLPGRQINGLNRYRYHDRPLHRADWLIVGNDQFIG
jgi:hypothetical protein